MYGLVTFASDVAMATGLTRLGPLLFLDIGAEGRFDLNDLELVRSARRGIVIANGLPYRDHCNLEKHREEVCRLLRPKEDAAAAASKVVTAARSSCDVLVGVHVRRGDHAVYDGGRFFYTLEQYRTSMARAARLWLERSVGFLICSNEALPGDAFNGFDWTPGPGGMMEDLVSLSMCDHIIGPPSTFSM